MITIVIPAHNEAAAIGRTLAALTKGAAAGALDVIVVCNGCSDDTAEVARAFGGAVRVIETDRASKADALNRGDAAAAAAAAAHGDASDAFPRIYADADVGLPLETVRELARVLDGSGAIVAAAPKPQLDLTRSSFFVRAYYRIDCALPWFREGIGNSGVYALSKAGRARFGVFPAITTDDSFVRVHFRPEERATLASACAVVTAPSSLAALISIKTRSHFSKWELERHCPELLRNDHEGNLPALVRLACNPFNWLDLVVYGWVKIAARFRCWRRYDLDRANVWERDETSRSVAMAEVDVSGVIEVGIIESAVDNSSVAKPLGAP